MHWPLLPLFAASLMAGDGREPGPDLGTGIDVMENIFGATNINATSGHGGLSAGFSKEGDLTVLSWPGPSYADQLAYLSSNDVSARIQDRFGALEGMGAFFGLVIDTSEGRQVRWLRDREHWVIEQSYSSPTSINPRTSYLSEELGLLVTVNDAIHPEKDILVRSVQVEKSPDSPVESLNLLSYANLSPVPRGSKVAKLPVGDWVTDGRNDYAALWDQEREHIVHFHPSDQRVLEQTADLIGRPAVDFGAIGDALASNSVEVSGLVAGLDQYADGAYLGMTTVPAPDQHHIGFDTTPFCSAVDRLANNLQALPERFPNFESPLPDAAVDALRCPETGLEDFHATQGWTYLAQDALEDARDGELSGSDIAAGEVNEALRTPMEFEGAMARAQLVLAAAPNHAALAALLDEVRADEVARESNREVARWLQDKALPETLSPLVRQVARRSLLNVRVGTDRDTGAVVASIARQPPYNLDWPRDGAFFNVLFDISGQSELVTRRSQLYASWQRQSVVIRDPLVDAVPPPFPDGRASTSYPAHAWEMNYFADSTPGGIFRFEIDTTAFAVWTMVAHVGWLPEEERVPYLESLWPSIRSGTNLLETWKDEATGLQAPAQEDDSGAHTQTIHGAVTVLGALELASRAAVLIDEDEDAARWAARYRELRAAILEQLFDAEARRFIMGETARGPFAASGLTPSGPTGWAVWPMTVLPLDDEVTQSQVSYDLGIVTPMIDLEEAGGLYFMKNTNAAAVALLGLQGEAEAAQRAELRRLVEVLASHASPDTKQFGEVMVVVADEDGTRRPEQRTATPHLWESSLFYLTAMGVENPKDLLRYDEALPPMPGEDYGADCGCQSQQPSTPWSSGLLFLLALLPLRRRRYSATQP